MLAMEHPDIESDDTINFGAIYNFFVKTLEEKSHKTCKVFQIRIPSPPKCKSYPTPLLDNPIGYVVRDETCIHIKNMEKKYNDK